MNDLLHTCEPWAERISLAAADCLSPAEEQETRRHIETCSNCRARFQQLTRLVGELTEARFPAVGAEAAIVERVMSAFSAEGLRRPLVGTEPEMIHPMLVTRSLDTWRWIMRSPVSRVAAAAVFLLALTGVALWFHGGSGPAFGFAEFIAPIVEAKSAKFKVTAEIMGPPATTSTSEVMVLDATRSRQEIETAMPDRSKTEKSNKFKMVMIFDWGQGKSLALDPTNKKATVFTLAKLTREQASQQDTFGWCRSMLLDARDKPDFKRESLGEKNMDGRRVVGFRVSGKGMVMSLWGDPKTGLPVRIEATMAMFANTKMTMSDFVFNVDLDKSLFSIEPPAGYTVQNVKIDVSQPQEKDLMETFREWSKLNGGAFPNALNMQGVFQIVMKKFPPGKGEKPSEQQMAETQVLLQRGLMFALVLPADADAHYAGKGVSFGASDKPIFWYHPKDTKKYRVIYADLSVRDADTPPQVPDAQRVPDLSTPKK